MIQNTHTNPISPPFWQLAGQADNQTAWGMFFIFHMGVSGLVAHPWVARPMGNTPAIPDGNLHLTINPLNLHIHVNWLLL